MYVAGTVSGGSSTTFYATSVAASGSLAHGAWLGADVCSAAGIILSRLCAGFFRRRDGDTGLPTDVERPVIYWQRLRRDRYQPYIGLWHECIDGAGSRKILW